jgi:putative DNA primase/helicase
MIRKGPDGLDADLEGHEAHDAIPPGRNSGVRELPIAKTLGTKSAYSDEPPLGRFDDEGPDVPPTDFSTGDDSRSIREPIADDLPASIAPFTDLANAHRLLRRHGEELRFTRSHGWLVYDGARFNLDATGAAERRVHEVHRQLLARAAALRDIASREADDRRQCHLRGAARAHESWAKKSQQEPRMKAALSVASTLDGIACDASAFDVDHWLLNCQNGTVDLRTGTLRQHDRADLLTKLAPVSFDPNAECPVWVAFLDRVFASNGELVAFVQRALGYSMTASTSEQCFFVLFGSGANGKSTLLETVRFVLGDYAMNTGTDTFLRVRDSRGPENDIARLRGARFVSAVESGEGRRLDEERIKRFTGTDTMTARFLYREPFEFVPSGKVWLAVNDRPEITGVDHGIWRRVRLVPFEVTIPEHERDRELMPKLRTEAPGILRWLVEGCRRWQAEGLNAPRDVTAATDDWRHEANIVAKFVADCCDRGGSLSVKSGAFTKQYAEWSKEQGEENMSAKAISTRLKALGFRSDRTKASRIWRGLALRSEVTDDA